MSRDSDQAGWPVFRRVGHYNLEGAHPFRFLKDLDRDFYSPLFHTLV